MKTHLIGETDTLRACGFRTGADGRTVGAPWARILDGGRFAQLGDGGPVVSADVAAAILAALAPHAVCGRVDNARRAARGRAWAALFACAYDPADAAASLRDTLADIAHAVGAAEFQSATRIALVHLDAEVR